MILTSTLNHETTNKKQNKTKNKKQTNNKQTKQKQKQKQKTKNKKQKKKLPHTNITVTGLSQFMLLIVCGWIVMKTKIRSYSSDYRRCMDVTLESMNWWFCIALLLDVVTWVECLSYLYSVSLNNNVKQRPFALLDLFLWRRYPPVKLAHRYIYYCTKGSPLGAFYPWLQCTVNLNSNFAILKTWNCFQLEKRIIWAFSFEGGKGRRVFALLEAFSWKTDLWVTLGDFTEKKNEN